MNKELIDIELKSTVEKIVDILENFSIDRYENYTSAVDRLINEKIDETVERTIHSLADTIAYEFKIKHYKNIYHDDTI